MKKKAQSVLTAKLQRQLRALPPAEMKTWIEMFYTVDKMNSLMKEMDVHLRRWYPSLPPPTSPRVRKKTRRKSG